MPSFPTDAAPSPCTGLCVLDPEGFCRGCRRSMDEIAHWSQLDERARRAVLAVLPARAAATPWPPPPAGDRPATR